jgi:hypothetical protein
MNKVDEEIRMLESILESRRNEQKAAALTAAKKAVSVFPASYRPSVRS